MAGAIRSTSLGTYAFNPYSAGAKKYGVKSSPTIGAVDKSGYAARDRHLAARKAAVREAMKSKVGK
jgi:hypothetical protein